MTTTKEEKIIKKEEKPVEKKEVATATVPTQKAKMAFIKVARILKKPVVTEKSAMLSQNNNEYVFKVDIKATKTEVKQSIKDLYNVEIESVNTIIRKGKAIRFGKTKGVRSDEKFAIIKVKAGQDINLFK